MSLFRNVFKHFITSLIAISLIYTPVLASTSTSPGVDKKSKQDYKVTIDRLDKYMNLLSKLVLQIDRSQFDLDALLENLDYNEKNIIDYVKDNISFEQYNGVLRGAKGTLMSKAGNTLDQSILTATLLNNAGLEARIVRGKISKEHVELLFNQMKIFKNKSKSPFIDDKKSKEIFKSISYLSGNFDPRMKNLFESISTYIDISKSLEYNRTENIVNNLLTNINSFENNMDNNEYNELLINAREYFWIQYRLGSSSEWQDVHPSFSNKDVLNKISDPIETFTDSIPEKYYYKFSIDVDIEQSIGSKKIISKIVPKWEKPVANLVGKMISYTNYPNNFPEIIKYYSNNEVLKKVHLDKRIIKDSGPLFETNKIILPLLNGTVQKGTSAFDMEGNLVDSMVFNASEAGLYKTINSKMGDVLGNLKNDKDFISLENLTMNIELTGPNAYFKSWKRSIYDKNSSIEAISKNQKIKNTPSVLDMLTDVQLSVTGFNYPEGYLIDNHIKQVKGMINIWKYLINNLHVKNILSSQDKSKELTKVIVESKIDSAKNELLNTLEFMSLMEKNQKEYIVYKAEPTVILNGLNMDINEKLYAQHWIDVINNKKIVLENDQLDLKTSFKGAIVTGVWDTLAEFYVFNNKSKISSSNTCNVMSTTSAILDIENGIKANTEALVLSEYSNDKLSKYIPHKYSRDAIQRDIKNGYIVVVPRQYNKQENATWWRIDPKTGETLGLGIRGEGANMLSYVVTLMGSIARSTITAALARFVATYLICIFAIYASDFMKQAFKNKPKDGRFMSSGDGKIPEYNPLPPLGVCLLPSLGVGTGSTLVIASGAFLGAVLSGAISGVIEADTDHLFKKPKK